MRIVCCVFLFLLLGSAASASDPVSFRSLLLEMIDRDRMTRPSQPAYTAEAATSYDRASTQNDPADGLYIETKGRDWGKGWFANRDFNQFVRTETNHGRQEHVLMEDDGPGALVRWWCTANNNGKIRIYLDGSDTPTIEGGPAELVGGTALAAEPFSFKASDDKTNPDWRGHNLYLPIPYQSGCKVTWEGGVSYYQIGYRKYEPGTKVHSFTMQQLEDESETLEYVAKTLTSDSVQVQGTAKAVSDVKLRSGESAELALSGEGAIRRLTIQLDSSSFQQALRSTVLKLTFDGSQTAWVPVGALGGVGYSAEVNKTFSIRTDPATQTITSLFNMPFRSSAKVELVNYAAEPVGIKRLEAVQGSYDWNESSMHFYATWFELRNISTVHRSDLNYVTVQGAGRYVGTSITVFNTCTLPNNQTWWGEGDDKVYVDGEEFPSIFGTGTEDYFGYAYCRPQRFNTPFISQPRGEGNKKWGYSNNNRYHLLDDIPFTKSVKFDMEVWHPFRKQMNYAAATFFYARPGSTHNIEADIDAVKYPVALHRDDVLACPENVYDPASK